MVDVYQTEPERRAALEEVTRLRREFDTTTAKGAKAFAASPEAQAALARLDAAKSAAGMRTRAEDLAALNKIATRDVATADMTPAQKRVERQALNQPSRQYFKQVSATINDTSRPPAFAPKVKAPDGTITNKIPQQWIDENKQYGMDYSNGRLAWMLVEPEPGQFKWAVGLMGGKRMAPTTNITNVDLAKQLWMSDADSLANIKEKNSGAFAPNITGQQLWNTAVSGVSLDELQEAIPEIRWSEFQEIIYQLTLEKDDDITIEDVLDKYDEMYGEG